MGRISLVLPVPELTERISEPRTSTINIPAPVRSGVSITTSVQKLLKKCDSDGR